MVSVAVVDDPAIHRLNREFLQHDYPTDVLSFLLEREGDQLEGEVIVSSDTAVRSAAQYGWTPENELLLYVIHGTLHLVGYDDLQPELLAEMRRHEQHYLGHFGLAASILNSCSYLSLPNSPAQRGRWPVQFA